MISRFLALLGVAAAQESEGTKEFKKNVAATACYVYTDLAFYDISALQKEEPWSLVNGGFTYTWNFCRFDEFCSGQDKALAAAKSGVTCQNHSGDSLKNIKRELVQVSDKDDKEDDDEDDEKSLYLTYTQGSTCSTNSDRQNEFQIRLLCEDDQDDAKIVGVNPADPCKPIITMKSKHGCPKFSSTAIVEFFTEHPWVLAVILLAFGAVVTFFGRKFFQWTLAALGFLAGFGASALLFSLMGLLDGLTKNSSPLWLAIVCLIIALCLGGLAGFVLFKTYLVGACVLGAFAGAFGMIALYNLAFQSTESFWLLLVMILVGVSAGVFLAFKFFDWLVIGATSLVGGYAFVRGISMFAGGFPNELVLLDKLANGVRPEFEPVFYAYLVGIVLLTGVGFWYQRKQYLEEKEDGFHRA